MSRSRPSTRRSGAAASCALLVAVGVVSACGPIRAAQPSAPAIRDFDTLTSRWGRVTKVGDEGTNSRLLFNGRTVLTAHGINGDRLDAFSADAIGPVDAFVLGAFSGSACPYNYAVVAISPDHKVRVSKPFGTCSDMLRVVHQGDALIITMPDYLNPEHATERELSRLHMMQYVYRAGRVSAEKDLGMPTKADWAWMAKSKASGEVGR